MLYGPQGELFGKNNDAGVINVTTKRPSSTFQAMGEVTGGNYNDKEAKGSITGPLTDWASGRLYVGYQQNKGFLQVSDGIGPSTDRDTNSRKAYTVRGQLLLTPNDDIDVLFIADYSKRNESCCGAVLRYPGPFEGLLNAYAGLPALGGNGSLGQNLPTGVGQTPLPNSYLAFANQPITQHVRDYGLSGELNWNLGFGKLTSITAWRDNTVQGGNDVDYSGIDLLRVPDNDYDSTDFKQFSEELRLAGKQGPLNWLVGLFFNSESLTPRGTLLAGSQFETYISSVAQAANGGSPFPPTLVANATGNAPGATFATTGYIDSYRQTSKSYALFTDETWNVFQGFDLTAGLRATKEKKHATASFTNTEGGPLDLTGCNALLNATNYPPGFNGSNGQKFLIGYGCFTGWNPFFNGTGFDESNDEGNVSGTLKASYRFNDEVMAYISGANGYKAGGYNLSRTTFTADPTGACPPTATAFCTAVGPAAPLLSAGGLIPNYDTAFPRETVESGEVGVKATLFNRTLRLNTAAFYQHYKDFQLNTFTGIQFVVTSLKRVVSKGVDMDFAWASPIPGFGLNGGVTYAFTNIDDFGNALAFFAPNRLNNRLSFAPLWSSALSAVYSIPFTSTLGLRTSIEEKYSSSYNTGSNLDPRKIQGAFGLMNARVGLGAPDESWAIEAWAANLTNKYYYAVAFDAPFQYQTIDSYLGAPRTFGLTARVKFK